MNCNQARILFDELLDHTLMHAEAERLAGHMSACEPCRQALAREQGFREALRELPVAPARPGYAAAALRAAGTTTRSPQRKAFIGGFASAAAVAAVAWLSMFAWPPSVDAPVPAVTVTLHQVRAVELAFNVPRAIDEATLTMAFPPDLELAGYPAQRRLRWTTRLDAGANVIALPIIARGAAGGDIVATIAAHGKSKTFRVKVDVSPDAGPRLESGGMPARDGLV